MSIAPIDTSAAERRASRIRLRLDGVADSHEANLDHFRRILGEIKESVEQYGDHIELGYRSHTEYVADRFGGAMERLGVEHRREAVGVLSDLKMSTRAIAAVVGVSNKTVHGDLVRGVTPGNTSEPTSPTVNTETGEVSDDYLSADATGEEVTSSTEAEANTGGATPAADDVEEAPGEEVEPAPSAPSRPDVTGIDGKTYKQREQPKPRRNPLTDQARDAGWGLRRSVERLERIAADDRFNPNKEAVASHLRGHLTNAIEVCQDLLDRINTQEESTK